MSARKKIFFDGFLPHSKLTIRSKRLKRRTAQSLKYCEKYKFLGNILTTCRPNVPPFQPYQKQRRHFKSPPLPFIVPVVLEALLQSEEFKHKTEVVPWEADPYCASYIREFGGLILTSDSDLLLYDLGPTGKVAFLIDLKKRTKSPEIFATVYHPPSLIDKLKLKSTHGLFPVAFELLRNGCRDHDSVVEGALSLKTANLFPDSYKKFVAEYNLEIPELKSPTEDMEMKLFLKLRSLDPRISEYILQFPSFAEVAQQVISTECRNDDKYRIFLPFLVDSPNNTSGWEISVAIRQLAYGLINIAVPNGEQIMSVLEHRRLGIGFDGVELKLPTVTEISKACTRHCQIHLELEKELSNLSSHEIWVARAILQELGWSLSQSKPSMSTVVNNGKLEYKSISKFVSSCGWDFIHLFAQIEASLYSFRFLYQIFGVVTEKVNRESIPSAMFRLYHILGSLPDLKEFKDRSSIADFLNDHLFDISSVATKILSVYSLDTAQNFI